MTEKRPICCGKPMKKSRGKSQSGNTRYQCGGKAGCGVSTTNLDGPKQTGYDQALADANYDYLIDAIKNGQKKFVVTSAMNNTRLHTKQFESLLKYCYYNDADLIVIPIHYKNVSAFTANETFNKKWVQTVQPFILDKPLKLGGNVIVRADIRIAATAANPLEGKQAINGRMWTIFGHSQFAMEPVATPADQYPKRMYTTGCTTVRNYSQTNMGAKAEFHHVQGALVVEVVGRRAFVRQLNANSDGCFYDLDKYYTPEDVTGGHRALALTTGDEHVKHHNKKVRKATYDAPDSITNVLKPKHIFRHDVLDAYFCSHHHEKDDIQQFRKYHMRDHNGRKELDDVVKFINETTPIFSTTHIVPSNHHDHLKMWLNRVDEKKDHENAQLIYELKAQLKYNVLHGLTDDPLEIYLTPRLKCDFHFLDRSKPYVLKSVDYSQHGDKGINGARGSARSFAKTVYQMVIGHSHGARIVKGTYQVGTSANRMEYETGLGDHTHTHCIQYANGKRTLIDIIGGRWHG